MSSSQSAEAIPVAEASWLLGNLPEFRSDMFEFLVGLRERYGPIASFRLGPRRLIILNDPSLIEEVLVTKNRQFWPRSGTAKLSFVGTPFAPSSSGCFGPSSVTDCC